MKLRIMSVVLIALALSTAQAKVNNTAPEGSPTRAIQDLDTLLDSYILHPKTEAEQQFNVELKRKILHGTFDVAELCRIALDKHWKDIKKSEQDSFADLMTRLLEKKAVFSKEQGMNKGSKSVYFVSYEGEKFLTPDKNQSIVRTLVQIPSEHMKIGLNYKLKKAGEIWKIFDVIVDDASLAENYKYQFDKIISQSGYPELVHRMESKLKDLEQQDKP